MRFGPLQTVFNSAVANMFEDFDFQEPRGEEALYPPESLTWDIYKNPLITFIGGISAVIMQLSEPRIRSGVWEHSSFRDNAVTRIKRTGLASMATTFGPASKSKKMIHKINVMHSHIHGTTPCGKKYRANDPDLLRWVQETVTHSMLSAYASYIREPNSHELEQDYKSKKYVAGLYGVKKLSRDSLEREKYFKSMIPTLERSPVIFEFLDIVKSSDLFPSRLKPFQRLLVNAAVANVPDDIKDKIGLHEDHTLKTQEDLVVKFACRVANRAIFETHPAVIACNRIGLPSDHLYKKKNIRRLEH